MKRDLIFLLFMILISSLLPCYAQRPDSAKTTVPQEIKANPKPKNDTLLKDVVKMPNTPNSHFRTNEENSVTVMLLIFGVVVLIIAAVIIYKFAADVNQLFKYFIIILIIIGSILLILIGYDKDQITPAVGLFGSIAGYLLGRSDSPANNSQQQNKNPNNEKKNNE